MVPFTDHRHIPNTRKIKKLLKPCHHFTVDALIASLIDSVCLVRNVDPTREFNRPFFVIVARDIL